MAYCLGDGFKLGTNRILGVALSQQKLPQQIKRGKQFVERSGINSVDMEYTSNRASTQM